MTTTQKIVKDYLNQTKLSTRKFGKCLGVSHATIAYWATGKTSPDISFLISCHNKYDDWRKEFANDLLANQFPNVWKPNGNGGKQLFDSVSPAPLPSSDDVPSTPERSGGSAPLDGDQP